MPSMARNSSIEEPTKKAKMIKDKRIIVILCFLFCLGCTSDEYQQAEQAYLQAKSSHNISQLVTSLTVLARLAPEEYSALSLTAQQANVKHLESKKYIEQKNYYLAYISSHDSLHKMYSVESKEILEESGVVFLPILKAKKNLDDSYQHHPLDIASLAHYEELPTLDWDLIELNSLLKKFSENIRSLEKSIGLINTISPPSFSSLSSEILSIELRIKNQHLRYKQAQNYLIDLALYRNAKLLISLNQKLSKENITISQIFNDNKIDDAMRPFLEKSINKYAANKNVIENIFFAASTNAKKHHSVWYKKWQRLEAEIFEPIGGFVNYSLYAKHTNERLMVYVNKKKIQLPTIEKQTMISLDFFQENKVISALIEKLAKDSRFFNS